MKKCSSGDFLQNRQSRLRRVHINALEEFFLLISLNIYASGWFGHDSVWKVKTIPRNTYISFRFRKKPLLLSFDVLLTDEVRFSIRIQWSKKSKFIQ